MHTVLKNLERIEITGVFSESEAAFEFCRIHNYHITRSGPAPTETPHRYDVNTFLIIAERETPQNKRVQPTAQVAKRNGRKSSSRKSSTVRGG